MKTFFLIRHAKSSWDYPELTDIERPLNKRGIRDAPTMGKKLYETNCIPDLMISSTAKRAKSTAFKIAKELDYPKEQIRMEENLYHATDKEIIKVVKRIKDKWNTVFLFGHNPGFTEAANMFNTSSYISNLPTCGIVRVESTANSWSEINSDNSKVVSYIFPKMF